MFEEVAPELLVVVPAVVGAVALLVALVFWLGSGRQRSFEEEKAMASKRAEEALREREKAQQGGKKKKPFARRKAAARGSGGEEEEGGKGTETPEPALKPILKASGKKSPAAAAIASPARAVSTSPERSPLKVDFQLEEMTTPKPMEKKSPFQRTLTPHPSTLKQKAAIARRIEMEEEEEDNDVGGKPELIKDEAPSAEDEPKPKPSSARQAAPKAPLSTSKVSSSAGGGQKKRQKHKQPTELDPSDGLPFSKLSDIVEFSPLSDDDIQQLIEQLLEKMNTNSEWQAANLRQESVKSLKKANQDLSSRCEEAGKTVVAHSNKIRELRASITAERTRHQSSETSLQAKISQQAEEMNIAKAKILGFEEDIKQLKDQSTPHAIQQVEEKNASLQHQMAALSQSNSSLSSQLVVTSQQAQELQDANTALRVEVRRAKEALKTSSDVRSLTDRISDLEGILAGTEQENQELQAAMQATNEEVMKMSSEMKAVMTVKEERDSLAQEVGKLEDLIRQSEEKMAGLSLEVESHRGAGTGQADVSTDGAELLGRVAELETENASLRSEIEGLQQKRTELERLGGQLGAGHADGSSPSQAELEAKWTAEVARVKAECDAETREQQSQHDTEVQALRERLSQAEGAHSEREREVDELRGRLKEQEERTLPLESQLRQVMEQLSDKKELEGELEKLRQVSNGSQTENGVPSEGGGEKQPVVSIEVHQEVVRAKEEEVAKVTQEKEALSEELHQVEVKLEELKTKNNELRNKCWKARDDAAGVEKAFEQKLQQTYRDAEKRSKAAKTEAIAEAQDAQKSLLVRLFPDVSIDDADFSVWLDDFETEALDVLQENRRKVSSLEEKVEELRENEHKSIKEAEQLRETLNVTMGILSNLQSEVDTESEGHQRKLEERDEMLDRERQANRGLQDELRKERDANSQLQKGIEEAEQKATTASEDLEHHYQVAQAEAETLRHSLHHELEMKETMERKVDKMEERENTIEERMKAVVQEKEEADKKNHELSEEMQQLHGRLKEAEDQLQTLQLANAEQKTDAVTNQIPVGSTEV